MDNKYFQIMKKLYPDGETAYLFAHGCELIGSTDSDLNYHRLELIGGADIAFTPGRLISPDRKVYRNMYIEFNGCVHYTYRHTHKYTGKPLKKSVKELLNSNAMHIDTEYKVEVFDGRNVWNASYRLSPLEKEIWENNYSYTKKDVLQFLNRYGVKKYNNVVIVQDETKRIINTIGGFREKEILQNDSVMSIGETWNAEHKIIRVQERINNQLGRSCEIDLVSGRVTN